MLSKPAELHVDRWMEEQLFEEDVRAVMKMLRPNARERLEGWNEYRAGGKDFRATISWKPNSDTECNDIGLVIPNMTDVLEAILIGSARSQDELTADEEFEIYRRVVRELYQRLNELESQCC